MKIQEGHGPPGPAAADADGCEAKFERKNAHLYHCIVPLQIFVIAREKLLSITR